MSVKNVLHNSLPLVEIVGSNPRMLHVSPSILWFLNGYMSKFHIRRIGNSVILHSHLPPLNSAAYSRFVNEHLLDRTTGPSHAQVGITNACPQRCEYCYNRNRQGHAMDTETILKTIRQLKDMGMVWLGLTGGEPLLNKDIVEIVESASGDCAVKLFTTGCTLTLEKASQLQKAGLFSVSVSLDHWREEVHDRGRRYDGAFREALKAIDMFRTAGGIQVSVSAVLSREMIENDQVEEYLDFIEGLGVHEAWLSEVKPSIEALWSENLVITEEQRRKLVRLQNRHNAGSGMTVNYLGHFEGKECFGCNAGNKMVYIDAFGDVSPCVFTPLNLGNVQTDSLPAVFAEMREHFPTEDVCFINKNYRLLQKHMAGKKTLGKADTLMMLDEVQFGGLSRFNALHYGSRTPQVAPARATSTGE
ncbi:MAG: radical SAM protein [Dehalococcoidia bacterium]|nr:radical SAM protein [Dehalococcoidia bacterium]